MPIPHSDTRAAKFFTARAVPVCSLGSPIRRCLSKVFEGIEMGLSRTIFLIVLGVVAAAELRATPLIAPYVTRTEASYEGGYRLELEVCGDVLCKLELVTPKKRFTVQREKLVSIVEPDIRTAQLFIDPSHTEPGFVSIEIPLGDYDRKFFPMQKLFVLRFSDRGLESIEEDARGAVK